MYEVINSNAIYVTFSGMPCGCLRPGYHGVQVHGEKGLIRYLAYGFTRDRFGSYDMYTNQRFDHEYIDTYGRRIEPKAYRLDAWIFFTEHIRYKPAPAYDWRKSRSYRGSFRRGPVSGIHKQKHCHRRKCRRARRLIAMWHNPEYRGFNRGKCKIYLWEIEDMYVKPERSWKRQRKVHHQWMR